MTDDFKRMFRRDSPDTSIEAAGRIYERLNQRQQIVLRYAISMGKAGFSHEDACHALPTWGPSTVRTRVAELRDMGLVKDTGQLKTHPPNERHFTVWRFVPLAEREAEVDAPSDQPDLFRR
jgi:hypothetical protein